MRVLVVEDDVAMAESLRWGLREEGYAVDLAHTGEDGLWRARENAYDVIILDVMLPGIDGYQICARLRTEGRWTPILMLTAMDDDLDQAEGLDSGADDYLAKPFSYPVLLARLRALTRRALAERPVVLTAGALRLDPAGRRCRLAGSDLDLTAREFAVLELLMRRKGQAVSKAEVLEHCWDAAYDGDPAVVEVHVHHIRRKIDAGQPGAVIRTVRGAGYRLDSDDSP
jgi:two-component system OmpR family response regulator